MRNIKNIEQEIKKWLATVDIDKDAAELEAKIYKLELERKERKGRRNRRIIFSTTVAAAVLALFIMIYKEDNYTIREHNIDDTNIVTVAEAKSVDITIPTIITEDGLHVEAYKYMQNKSTSKEVTGSVIETNLNVGAISVALNVQPQVKTNTLIVPSGCTYTMILPDETLVRLNANSKLIYPVTFSGDTREVTLIGEGYFDVTSSNKPFIVKANDCAVKVYGTIFNINTNRVKGVETILVEGSVGVTAGGNEVIIKPNQMAKVNAESQIEVNDVTVERYLGWLNNDFYYENEELSVVLSELSAWYNVKFKIDKLLLNNLSVSLNLKRDIKLTTVINIFEDILEVEFINEGNNTYYVESFGEERRTY